MLKEESWMQSDYIIKIKKNIKEENWIQSDYIFKIYTTDIPTKWKTKRSKRHAVFNLYWTTSGPFFNLWCRLSHWNDMPFISKFCGSVV